MTPDEQREAIAKIRQALDGRFPPVDVMLIEDDIGDAELTLHRLDGVGIRAAWVRKLEEMEEYLLAHNPWLVFLDLKLTGFIWQKAMELVKQLRPESRVVVLTGAYQHDSVECKEALTCGAVAVMLKPLTTEQIQLIFGTPTYQP